MKETRKASNPVFLQDRPSLRAQTGCRRELAGGRIPIYSDMTFSLINRIFLPGKKPEFLPFQFIWPIKLLFPAKLIKATMSPFKENMSR